VNSSEVVRDQLPEHQRVPVFHEVVEKIDRSGPLPSDLLYWGCRFILVGAVRSRAPLFNEWTLDRSRRIEEGLVFPSIGSTAGQPTTG